MSTKLFQHVTRELGKPFIIVMTKVDLIPEELSEAWANELRARFPTASVVQFSSAGKRVSPDATLSARRRHIEDARKGFTEYHLLARW